MWRLLAPMTPGPHIQNLKFRTKFALTDAYSSGPCNCRLSNSTRLARGLIGHRKFKRRMIRKYKFHWKDRICIYVEHGKAIVIKGRQFSPQIISGCHVISQGPSVESHYIPLRMICFSEMQPCMKGLICESVGKTTWHWNSLSIALYDWLIYTFAQVPFLYSLPSKPHTNILSYKNLYHLCASDQSPHLYGVLLTCTWPQK